MGRGQEAAEGCRNSAWGGLRGGDGRFRPAQAWPGVGGPARGCCRPRRTLRPALRSRRPGGPARPPESLPRACDAECGPGPQVRAFVRAGCPYRSRGRLGHGPELSGPARRKSPPPLPLRGPTQAGPRPLLRHRPPGLSSPPASPRSLLAGPRRSVRRRAAAVSARTVHTASWEPAQAREASWRQRGRTAPPAARRGERQAPASPAPPHPAPPRGPAVPRPLAYRRFPIPRPIDLPIR